VHNNGVRTSQFAIHHIVAVSNVSECILLPLSYASTIAMQPCVQLSMPLLAAATAYRNGRKSSV